jgi:hypothetical protein
MILKPYKNRDWLIGSGLRLNDKLKKLYQVEHINGAKGRNYCTGTTFYQRKGDAVRLSNKYCHGESTNVVVEYNLVPTGIIYNSKGEIIE